MLYVFPFLVLTGRNNNFQLLLNMDRCLMRELVAVLINFAVTVTALFCLVPACQAASGKRCIWLVVVFPRLSQWLGISFDIVWRIDMLSYFNNILYVANFMCFRWFASTMCINCCCCTYQIISTYVETAIAVQIHFRQLLLWVWRCDLTRRLDCRHSDVCLYFSPKDIPDMFLMQRPVYIGVMINHYTDP